MYKDFFEFLFQCEPIFNDFLLDWIFPTLLSIFLYGFVFKVVGGMYELGLIRGSNAGSFFHWFFRLGLVWILVKILNFLKYIFINYFYIIIFGLIIIFVVLLLFILIRQRKFINKKITVILNYLKFLGGFNHIWAIVVILSLAIISLVISIITFDKLPLISNILGNVFAGFITGLIILIVSGLKTSTKISLEMKLHSFKELNEAFIKYHRNCHAAVSLISKDDSDFINSIREAFYSANEAICTLLNFNRIFTLEKKEFWLELRKKDIFNATEINDKWLDIREKYNDFEFYPQEINKALKKELLSIFNEIDKDINLLEKYIKNEIKMLSQKLKFINSSLL